MPALIATNLLPVALFYAILLWLGRNLPFEDDYDSGLNFANHLVQLQGTRERAMFYLTSQHNEYKLFLGHAIVWMQLVLAGHLNFLALSMLGDLSLLVLGYVLWKMFLPDEQDFARRLALFLPVTLLVFEMQYWETLNWPLPGLQNLPVLGFAIGSIFLLTLPGRRACAGALALLVLAIAASGNGFLVYPVGALMLTLRRDWLRLAAWTAALAACAALYAFHYSLVTTQGANHQSLIHALMHPKILFLFAFLGAAAAWPVAVAALPLGAALCAFIVFLLRRGYHRRQPAVAYAVLFLLLTALAVAGLRADFGLLQGVPSRYRMYSDLLLVFAWFATVHEFIKDRAVPLRRNRLFIVALVFALFYSAAMDVWGIHSRRKRERIAVEGMTAFEHPAAPDSTLGPVLPVPAQDRTAATGNFDTRARAILLESERLKVYTPPPY